MQEFAVAADGRMTDRTVQVAIEQALAEVPSADQLAIEAHMTLWRAHNVYAASLTQAYEALGLSIPRFNMLRWLYQSPGHKRSITELGAYLDASAPNVTRMVKALEELGWVRRVSAAGDRRVVLVELVDKGKEDFAKLFPKALDIWSEVWSGLSLQEKATLSHVLAKLRLSLLTRYIGPEGYFPAMLRRQKRSAGQKGRTAEE
jgi:DNA-binding MarR family transcriptional regulator